MLFESVLIATLLLAGRTIPAQTLQAFGLHLVAEPFRAAYFGFRHGGGCSCGSVDGLCPCFEGVVFGAFGVAGVMLKAGMLSHDK